MHEGILEPSRPRNQSSIQMRVDVDYTLFMSFGGYFSRPQA
jgi:hypothetical protein